MIDFSKKIGKSTTIKQMDPILLYESLDRQASAGPLRDVQKNVLNDWYANHFADRDVIIKLHTGVGKTLIGLLLLQSRLNAGESPCLFVCPNQQLAKQVSMDAQKFGVKYILDTGGDLPWEFIEGKVILITYIQRVFNGKTIFGLDNNYQKIGTIVLDDSHACIDAIKSAFTMQLKRGTQLFDAVLSMFEESLKHQGAGTYIEIRHNDYSSSVLPIPYWDWVNKKNEVAHLFYKNQDDNSVKFAYPLLKDMWENCTAYVTSSFIEIVPDYNLISRFSSFVNCKQRVLMSATTQDDSFFIKGFDFSCDSILNPLTDKTHLWSGEKMILFPTQVSEKIMTDGIREWLCNAAKETHISIVVLVPSRRIADEYIKRGAKLAIGIDLETELSYLKLGRYGSHAVVFANRYDGIDLPDNQCRVLVIDGLPSLGNLSDRYEQSCREDSVIIATKVAQKIEQGLGRSVRGEKDYSVILMLGEDLIRFVKISTNQVFFSSQTQKQIEIAEEVTESVKADIGIDNPMKAVVSVINQCLQRDEGWKIYYKEKLDTIVPKADEHTLLDIIKYECSAEKALSVRDYAKAVKEYQSLANLQHCRPLEQGWYLQKVAKCEYFVSQLEAIKIQKRAHENNQYVLMPDGVVYSPISLTNQSYIQQITENLHKICLFNDLRIKVDDYLSKLAFGIDANVFEKALDDLGKLLGYQCQRPDNTYRVGPDNLWMTPSNRYCFVIECKNEVLQSRNFISKEEVGQMNNHIGWFEKEYPMENNVFFIHIHMTNVVSYQANYNRDVRIMTPKNLDCFKDSVRGFVREFIAYDLKTITEKFVNEALTQHKLRPEDIVKNYTERIIVEKMEKK